MKTPTTEEKVIQYEKFLKKLSSCLNSFDDLSIKELIENADLWCYFNKVGDAFTTRDDKQELINKAFLNLCETPQTSKKKKQVNKIYQKNFPLCGRFYE
jgi:hypothetical protein